MRRLTDWLTAALRAGIVGGRVSAASALPPTRALAEELGVSRGVVVEAYRRLADEGLVSARRGSATTVLPRRRDGSQQLHSRRRSTGSARAARDTIWLPRPWTSGAEIDLSPGVSDLEAFPRTAWSHAYRTALREATVADLGYSDPQGLPELRHSLTDWLARRRGIETAPEDIIVVAGVAQALTLISHVLRCRGTRSVAVEDPGSRGARDELDYWGLRTVPIPVDDEGIQVAPLADHDVDAVLLTPAHQFPTGVVLSPGRRRALLDWARSGSLIVEDDYDAEFRYDRTPVPALQGSDPDHVLYIGTASKILAPGLRIGWLIAPRSLRAALVAAKHASDLGSPVLPQLALARLIDTGQLERHLRLVKARQRQRRDCLLDALHSRIPDAKVQGVAAGLHLLVMLPTLTGKLTDAELAAQIRTTGLLVHPLSLHRHEPGPPGLVLGYAAHSPDQLRDAVRRIASVLPIET